MIVLVLCVAGFILCARCSCFHAILKCSYRWTSTKDIVCAGEWNRWGALSSWGDHIRFVSFPRICEAASIFMSFAHAMHFDIILVYASCSSSSPWLIFNRKFYCDILPECLNFMWKYSGKNGGCIGCTQKLNSFRISENSCDIPAHTCAKASSRLPNI